MTCFITVNDRHRIERKVYKPEEKMRIVMGGLSGAIEITEIPILYTILNKIPTLAKPYFRDYPPWEWH